MKGVSPLRRGAVARLIKIDRLLAGTYSTPELALGNKEDPLDEAIYIILSFQTDLKRFAATWQRLRSAYPSWDLLETARTRDIVRVIREGGLHYQKARTLKRLLAGVRRLSGNLSLDLLRNLSDDAAERVLTRLPGLSWKAARCVLLYSLRRTAFPIDGNTFRILKRVGVLRSDAVYRRRSLHDVLQAAVPATRRCALHINLVVHGQRTCLPLAPRCPTCPIQAICVMNGVPVAIRRRANAAARPSNVSSEVA